MRMLCSGYWLVFIPEVTPFYVSASGGIVKTVVLSDKVSVGRGVTAIVDSGHAKKRHHLLT